MGLHTPSFSIQVGGEGAAVGRSRLMVLEAKRIGGQSAQPFSSISLWITGSR